MQGNWVTHTLLVDHKVIQPLWKIVWYFLIKLNMYLLYDTILFIPEKWKLTTLHIHTHTHIHTHKTLYINVYGSFRITRNRKMSFNRWIVKRILRYQHQELLSAKRANYSLIHTTAWIHLKVIMLSEEKVNLKRLNTIWLHLYNILNMTAL
jgi:hypothetical protein